jgi:glycosyltransferase involved in cell wall biosynthesis
MGGAQYQIKCLLDYLRILDHYEIHYVARRVPNEQELDGYTIHRIGTGQSVPRFGYAADALELYRTLRRLRPAVIYQRIGCAYTGIAAEYTRRNECSLVWHAANDTDVQRGLKVTKRHALRDRIDRALLSHGIRRADRIVTQTDHQARLLFQHFGRQPDAVIANFHPDPTEIIDKSGPPRIVWVANLKRSKQPDAFLRLALALRDLGGARFVMIGAGAVRSGNSPWHDLVKQHIAAAPNVEYRGPLPQEAVNAELAKAHIFVNTSLYEGFANTFIQAWMRRATVVSLNVNPDGIFDGDAIGFHAGSEERLAGIVRRLIADPELRDSVARRASAYAMEFHSMKNAQHLEEIIRGAVDKRSGL